MSRSHETVIDLKATPEEVFRAITTHDAARANPPPTFIGSRAAACGRGARRHNLDSCSSWRFPIQVLAICSSALRAASTLPRALYSSASPK